MRKEPSAPFINWGYLPSLHSPLHFRVISSFPAHSTQRGQNGGGGGWSHSSLTRSWEEIVPDCSLAGEHLVQANSRISGMVGCVSSLWLGRQSSQAHAWESDQPVCKSGSAVGPRARQVTSPSCSLLCKTGAAERPLRGSVRRGTMQVKLLAQGLAPSRCGLLFSWSQKWRPEEGEGLAGLTELGLQ